MCPRVLARAAATVVVAAFCLGVGTTERIEEPEQPTLAVTREEKGAKGLRCGEPAALVVEHGPVPRAARAIMRYEVKADRPVPLALVEDALRVEAANVCADGLSVLRAEMVNGATGVTAVVATAWARREGEEA